MILTSDFILQLVSCTLGCVGFGLLFNVKGVQIATTGIGALFTWVVYYVLFGVTESNFLATLVGATFVAAYAQVMARVNKAPATIFLTVSVFPLVPGASLYYMMYYIVMEQFDMASEYSRSLLLSCLGIALGFIVIEIISKYLTLLTRWIKGIRYSEHGERY